MKMPEVSLDIIHSTTVSIEDGKGFWENTLDTMLQENHLLYQLLVVSGNNTVKSEDFKDGYQKGAALTYILLSRQIEAENMNEQWG